MKDNSAVASFIANPPELTDDQMRELAFEWSIYRDFISPTQSDADKGAFCYGYCISKGWVEK